MAKILSIVAIGLISTSAYANGNIEICQEVGNLAETTMEVRQSEVSIVEVIQSIQGSALAESIVKDAYRLPAMRSPDNKITQVKKFRNKWELTCLQSLK